MPFGKDLAPSMLHAHRSHAEAVARISWCIAEGALAYALDYSKERHQFGQPISSFQGLQWMLADMATQVEAARHLVFFAASKVDEGAADGVHDRGRPAADVDRTGRIR